MRASRPATERDADHDHGRRRERPPRARRVAGISISSPDSAQRRSASAASSGCPTMPPAPGRDQRADDRADGVGRVHAADQTCRILPSRGHRRPARAGSSRPRGSRPAASPRWPRIEIELEVERRASVEIDGIDRPVRQRRAGRVAPPTRAPRTAPSWHQPSAIARVRRVARHRRRRGCCRCRARPGTRRGSARTCRPWRRTAATACASRRLPSRAPSAPTARWRRRRARVSGGAVAAAARRSASP